MNAGLRARVEAHVASMRRYPKEWGGKPGTVDLIEELLARVAEAEAERDEWEDRAGAAAWQVIDLQGRLAVAPDGVRRSEP